MSAASNAEADRSVQGVQSLETGLRLFDVFMRSEHPCGLSELARRTGMHRAKAYRYLVSLQRAGWVAQEGAGRGYVPGPAVRQLALRWWQRQDVLPAAGAAAQRLCDTLGLTCFVAVWGTSGATAVRVCQPARAVAISVASGAVLGPGTSATGRLFAVWRGEAAGVLPAARAACIRQQGYATVQGDHVAGVDAVAAPVLDAQGQMSLALTLVGPASSVDTQADGPHVKALLTACAELSLATGPAA